MDVPPLSAVPPTVHPTANAVSGFGEQGGLNSSPALVIQNGSTSLRVGFAGSALEERKRLWFCDPWEATDGDIWGGGDDAGLLKNVCEVWARAISTLHVEPRDQPLCVTERPQETAASRERATQVAFESLQVPAFYLVNAPTVALYATGNTTSSILHSGDASTVFVPIYEGYQLPHAVQSMPLAGKDLTARCHALLAEGAPPTPSPLAVHVARKVKHACASAEDGGAPAATEASAPLVGAVSGLRISELWISDPEAARSGRGGEGAPAESQAAVERYFLPDGRTILIGGVPGGQEGRGEGEAGRGGGSSDVAGVRRVPMGCVRVGRAMFEPNIFLGDEVGRSGSTGGGKERQGEWKEGVASMVNASVNAVDVSVRGFLVRDCFVTGGNTHVAGFADALERHLQPLRLVRVRQADSTGGPAPFVGATILAALPAFGSMWISRAEYEESGPGIVHRKCF